MAAKSTLPHQPTPALRAAVEALCSFGIRHEDISTYLGIDEKTLRKYYREEIDTAKLKKIITVGKFAFKMASGAALKDGASHADCGRLAMFWLKTQAGFREKDENTSTDLASVLAAMANKLNE